MHPTLHHPFRVFGITIGILTCITPLVMADDSKGDTAQTSFDQVTKHLQPGGNFFMYWSTEEAKTAVGKGVKRLGAVLREAGGSEGKEVSAVIDVVSQAARGLGLLEITGVGISSRAVENGIYQNRIFIHHHPEENGGQLWRLFGDAP